MKATNKEILQTANAAVSNGDYEAFLTHCTEDTHWIFVGDTILKGKEAVRQYMKATYLEPPKFDVETYISDGDYLTVVGRISMKNPEGQVIDYDYCDVWKFRNGKMAELKAYVIETGSK